MGSNKEEETPVCFLTDGVSLVHGRLLMGLCGLRKREEILCYVAFYSKVVVFFHMKLLLIPEGASAGWFMLLGSLSVTFQWD